MPARDSMKEPSKAFLSLHASLKSTGGLKKSEDYLRSSRVSSLQTKASNPVLRAAQTSGVYDNTKPASIASTDSLKVEDDSLGKGWFNLKPVKMTEALKQDLEVIRMRNYIDPKRFYKSSDKIGKIVGVGSVIAGKLDGSSGRLTNRERQQSILEEVLHDSVAKDYSRRTFLKLQAEHSNKKKCYKVTKKERKEAQSKKKVSKLF